MHYSLQGRAPRWLVVPALALAAGLAVAPGRADAAAPVTAKITNGSLRITGDDSAQALALRLLAGDPTRLVVDVGDDGSPDFTVKRNRFTTITVETRGGDDAVRIDDSAGAFTDATSTTIDGGDGNDSLRGGGGRELFFGRGGNDTVAGGRGDDLALLGAGDDRFSWGPGEGNDVVEGDAGHDVMAFAGSGGEDAFDVSATTGQRVRLLRSIGAVTMDLDGVETIDLDARGGADTVTLHDVSGTSLTELDADVGAVDNSRDRVVLEGTSGGDAVEILGQPGNSAVVGLPASLRVRGAETTDLLTLNTLSGADSVSAETLTANALELTVDAGNGPDMVLGGAGSDVVLGGAGDDVVDSDRGDDVVFLGADQDELRWNPGDGSDVVEGQAGTDRLVFTGSGGSERIGVSANGQRIRLSRDIAAVVMDIDGVERLDTRVLAGADTLSVADLSGTSVRNVEADLAGVGSSVGDLQRDTVNVDGTSGPDAIRVAGANGTVDVTGLPATVRVMRAESASDRLAINGRAGLDTLDTSGLAPNTIGLSFTQ